MNRVTPKMRAFAREYVKNENQFGHGNGTLAALKAYNTESISTAAAIASENLRKPKVIALLQEEAEKSALDLIDIRAELREAKKDYAVRAKVNFDILDRTGYRPKDEQANQNVTIVMIDYGNQSNTGIREVLPG